MRPLIQGPRIGTPVAGLYAVRLVKGGPLCPLRIWRGFPLDPETREPLERGWMWRAELFEEEVDVWVYWPYCAAGMISEGEYKFLLADHRHAKQFRPDAPLANPRRRPDPLTVEPPF